MAVRVLLEGAGAEQAGEDLAAGAPGVAKLEIQHGRPGDKDWAEVASAVVTFLEAGGGAAVIAQTVLAWRDRVKKRQEPDSGSVGIKKTLVTGNDRYDLGQLTDDEVRYRIEQDYDGEQ